MRLPQPRGAGNRRDDARDRSARKGSVRRMYGILAGRRGTVPHRCQPARCLARRVCSLALTARARARSSSCTGSIRFVSGCRSSCPDAGTSCSTQQTRRARAGTSCSCPVTTCTGCQASSTSCQASSTSCQTSSTSCQTSSAGSPTSCTNCQTSSTGSPTSSTSFPETELVLPDRNEGERGLVRAAFRSAPRPLGEDANGEPSGDGRRTAGPPA